VYAGDDPVGYVDLSGMCRCSVLRGAIPMAGLDATPPTTTANNGRTDCSSLFQKMLDAVQRVRSGPLDGMQGLETRWFQMMRDGVLNGRSSFDRHVG
jgi:hypothetical protein